MIKLPSAFRTLLGWLPAIAVLVFAGMALAQSFQTQIYDPTTRKWVDYTPRAAAKFYNRHGQSPEEFRRQVVPFRTAEKPGTIIIDGDRHFLYLVQPNFQAIRYGIGVGRDGFGWAGIEMIARDPESAKWANGMPGGPDNPLGARAMYLYIGNKDSIYRIHGTNQPWTIGLNISSGCIRLNNEDVADLYSRVEVGAKVIVLMQGAALYKGV